MDLLSLVQVPKARYINYQRSSVLWCGDSCK